MVQPRFLSINELSVSNTVVLWSDQKFIKASYEKVHNKIEITTFSKIESKSIKKKQNGDHTTKNHILYQKTQLTLHVYNRDTLIYTQLA